MIHDSKHNYYSRLANKLLNVQRNSKLLWSILKIFLNNKKVPIIPPLFHENKLVTDLKKSWAIYFTEKSLSTINQSSNNIIDIIQQSNPNEAHGHHMIRIRMLKIRGKSICRPLEQIFNKFVSNGVFPSAWK